MIDNQYIICLAKLLIPKVNIVEKPILEIWHAWLSHLNYKVMQKVILITFNMELKGHIPLEIYKGCMVDRQQRQSSRESSSQQATKLLKFVYTDLKGPLPVTWLGQPFYIFFLIILSALIISKV